MVGWHHQLNGHAAAASAAAKSLQLWAIVNPMYWRSLECCNPWGHKESDMT